VEAAAYFHEGTELRVTCSLGAAQVIGDNTPAEVIKRADEALYQSKAAGRNCSHFHDGQICRPASDALEPETPPADQETRVSPESFQTADEAAFQQETGFHADLRHRVTESRKFHVPLSLLMLEIDDFDRLSEKYGAAIADLVYDTMEDFLRVVMQEMDVAARVGNGRFAVMMPGIDRESAVALAEQLRAAVENHTMQVKGVELRLTLSAGIAEILKNDDSSTLTKRAAAALFAARKGGGNCNYTHDGEHCAAAVMALC
jgi:diguanylate cyclase (GGDEF)-like protein